MYAVHFERGYGISSLPINPHCCMTRSIMHCEVSVLDKSLSFQSTRYIPPFVLALQIPHSFYISYIHCLFCDCINWFSHSYSRNTSRWCRPFLSFLFNVENISNYFCSAGQQMAHQKQCSIPRIHVHVQCSVSAFLPSVHCCAPLLLRSGLAHTDLYIFITHLSTPKTGVDIWGFITPLSFSLPCPGSWSFIEHSNFI